jgi:hypothetical protein
MMRGETLNTKMACWALFLLLCTFSEAGAEVFDVGVGVGVAGSGTPDLYDGVWDLQLGYEMETSKEWNFGAQLHLVKGWTSKSDVDEERAHGEEASTVTAFDSQALYLTARPEDWWLQFKAGIVHTDYHTVDKDESGVGAAVGIGLVVPSDFIQVHILDYHRYQVGGESFDVLSASVLIVLFLPVR